MHTFFINTSAKKFDEYSILWDIQSENKKLVPCKLSFDNWMDEEHGYKNCVKKLGDMIDAYAELNNTFNVVIYIDLTSNPVYAAIKKSTLHIKKQKSCLQAMYSLYSRIVSDTIVAEFERTVRAPENVLIMFGEYQIHEIDGVASNEPSQQDVKEYISELIGMPDNEIIEKTAREIDPGDNDKVGTFEQKIKELWKKTMDISVFEFCEKEFRIWCDQIIVEKNIEAANDGFLGRVLRLNSFEKTIPHYVSCPFENSANNKSSAALNQLSVILYMIQCVESGSVFDEKNKGEVKKFHPCEGEKLAELLKRKSIIFSKKIQEIDCISKSYSEQKLAPELALFDFDKFCLDRFGYKATELVLESNLQSEKTAPDSRDGNSDKAPDPFQDLNMLEKLAVIPAELRSLFAPSEYSLFEFESDAESKQRPSKCRPEQYIEYGKTIKKTHIDFMKKLKLHISERLSAYAGKSKENKPALLKIGENHYAAKGKKEDKSLETVEQIADNAYNSVLERYMEFCAGRTVSVTDICKQCDLYVTRINQITASLTKKRFLACVLLILFLVLYTPFVLIGRKFVQENSLTAAGFFVSFFLPVVVWAISYFRAIEMQKRKYEEEREKLEAESAKILEENNEVARKYDQMLSAVIPALRWVYEYKLDVEHYAACCRIADAKLSHHKKKLSERVKAIDNILADIECNLVECVNAPEDSGEIDYNAPFCSGEKNIKYYTITDDSFFEADKKEGESE